MQTEEPLYQIGAFEPTEARRLFPELESRGIEFDVESDHSALARPTRWLQQCFGMFPEGSKLLVFVPESVVTEAEALVLEMFPA
jgi:hypothetical protein